MEDEEVLERILDGAEDPKDLPFALLQKITENFSRDRKIGQGVFGEVYKGVLGQKIVAVKRIYITEDTLDDRLFRRECASLWNTNHQNVVRFLGFCSYTYKKMIQEAGLGEPILANVLERLLCFEYISNGSLDKHITDELRGLEWKTRYEIIIGICKGLRYLHEERGIIHMDLKPANILLHNQYDKYMVPKIAEFGQSRPNENSHTVGKCYVTQGYSAPEYKDDSRATPACDIYSLGTIIIELVTGCREVPNKHNVLRRWRHRWNKPPTQLQYQQVTRCLDIAGSCREQKPEDRPSISKIIRFLSESESTRCQISPCFNEDDMLGIKPLELLLPSELKNETSRSVELTNGTCNCIAFYIQLPPRIQCIAQPEKGIVQPESKCSVKITVQPRHSDDSDKFDYSDKFIVNSMKVSQVLIDEDITESMFFEAGKVVDDVNLVVVYEPMKPPKRSREDTNMPAEEVPEAKKREIVESASGKGKNKLGSSEKEEAVSMQVLDIDEGSLIIGRTEEKYNILPILYDIEGIDKATLAFNDTRSRGYSQVHRDRAIAAQIELECLVSDESAKPKPLPLLLLEHITSGFSDDRKIGSGGFAIVYKGMLKYGPVAVKKLLQTAAIDDKKFTEEVRCLMMAKHKNIVRFLGYCSDTQGEMLDFEGKLVLAGVQQRLLCFEYLPKGNLEKQITDASCGLKWSERNKIIKGICDGLYYLHQLKIIHLDLKPENILLDDNMMPKIADFGLSRCFDDKQSKVMASEIFGTMGYMAPEFLCARQITFKSDIYSLGIILIRILTGEKGYPCPDIDNVLESWRNRLGKSEVDAQLLQIRVCTQIAIDCTDFNPENRPDIHEIIARLGATKSADESATEVGTSG